MREVDFEEFSDMLDSVCSLISRGNYTPDDRNTALWFQSLSSYELPLIRRALSAHVKDPQRGRFVPTPADVVAQIDVLCNDGRPGVEEAWAMVPQDETQTAVWTTEMAEAYGIASPLIAAGDKVGARMAFKEAYTRAVAIAKAEGRPARWTTSLGSDPQHRRRTLRAAVEAGRITAEVADEASPRLSGSLPKLLLAAPQHLQGGIRSGKEKLEANVEAWRKDPPDPKRWARELKAREEAGENLRPSQRQAWRDALAYGDGKPTTNGGFPRIPEEVLPPGMRGQVRRQQGRAMQRAQAHDSTEENA